MRSFPAMSSETSCLWIERQHPQRSTVLALQKFANNSRSVRLSWVGLDISPTIATEITKNEVHVLIGRRRKRCRAHARRRSHEKTSDCHWLRAAVKCSSSFHQGMFAGEYTRVACEASCSSSKVIGDDVVTIFV